MARFAWIRVEDMRWPPKPPLRLQLETALECSADQAWDQERRIGHLLSISGPLIVLRASGGPPPGGLWHLGQVIELRGYVLGILPLGRQRIEVVRLDPSRRKIETEEGGGLIKMWRHRVTVCPLAADRCRYSDDILLDAGILTRPLRLLAALVYRLRQCRRRGHARRFSKPRKRSIE